MVTQVDELAALVTDLGELARGERSEGPLESLRLDEIVDECVDTARTYARIREITIEAQVEPSTVLGRRRPPGSRAEQLAHERRQVHARWRVNLREQQRRHRYRVRQRPGHQ